MSHPDLAQSRVPSRLAGAVALALLVGSPAVLAGSLVGGSATVNPGDVPETWTLRSNALLTINPGGQSDWIEAQNSRLDINGAVIASSAPSGPTILAQLTATQIESSTITGAVRFMASDATLSNSTVNVNAGSTNAITANQTTLAVTSATVTSSVSRALAAAEGSTVSVADSSFTGVGLGASVASGSTVTFDNTQLTAVQAVGTNPLTGGHGLVHLSGTANLLNGTTVTGIDSGVRIMTFNTAGRPVDVTLLVDRSSIVGQNGAAIVMALGTLPASWTANIDVRNGSSLVGGNGNLLDVSGGQTANLRVDDSALVGNVIAGVTDTANLSFQNNASLAGALTNVTSMALADTSRWDVTADSTVGTLDIGSGTLAFAAPSPSYKTVTVAGDFAVNGGTLVFNSPLGDDTSPSDKLVVGGNTTGSGNIAVNNIGGTGAQTVEGIQLISVAGTSDAAFALSGRAVGAPTSTSSTKAV